MNPNFRPVPQPCEFGIPSLPLPPSIRLPNAAFARKHGIIADGQPLDNDLFQGPMQPTADERILDMCDRLWDCSLSTYKTIGGGDDIDKDRRQRLLDEAAVNLIHGFAGPSTPGLFFDGGLDFRWETRPPSSDFQSMSQDNCFQSQPQETSLPGTSSTNAPLTNSATVSNCADPSSGDFSHQNCAGVLRSMSIIPPSIRCLEKQTLHQVNSERFAVPENNSQHHSHSSSTCKPIGADDGSHISIQGVYADKQSGTDLYMLPKTTYITPQFPSVSENVVKQEATLLGFAPSLANSKGLSSRIARSINCILQRPTKHQTRKNTELTDSSGVPSERGSLASHPIRDLTSFDGTIDEDNKRIHHKSYRNLFQEPSKRNNPQVFTSSENLMALSHNLTIAQPPIEPSPLVIRKQPSYTYKAPNQKQIIASNGSSQPAPHHFQTSSLREYSSIDFGIHPSHETQPAIYNTQSSLQRHKDDKPFTCPIGASFGNNPKPTASDHGARYLPESPTGIMGDFVPIESPRATPLPVPVATEAVSTETKSVLSDA